MREPRYANDQYHAFTARLAAAGYQTATMRLVGMCILSLGLSALLAGLEPDVSPWPGFRLVYTAIAAASVALAAPWFRYRWPTRRESFAVVVAGTFALAGGCLATIDPMAGLLTVAAFPFILGFCALFHSSRLLVFTAVAAGVSVVVQAVRIAQHEVTAAVAVTIPIVLLCVVITYACRTIATVGSAYESQVALDPITGLPTLESFYERAATLLGARNRGDDRYLVVVVLAIDSTGAAAWNYGNRAAVRATVSAGQALRATVRRDAVVGHLDDTEFVIIDTFTTPDPTPLGERVRGAVASTPAGITASIGVVSATLRPLDGRPPHEVLYEVIAQASELMAQARGAGGNQVRYAFDTDLGTS